MSRLLSHLRFLLRSVAQITDLQTYRPLRRAFRLSLLTAVAGYDNKRNSHSSRLRSNWAFGDDACFLAHSDSSYVLGVADGVGGWRTYGVDPGRFSRAIVRNCERLVNTGRFKPDQPELLIAHSYEDVLTSKDPIMGSATLCVIALHRRDHKLYAATLGDSGYLVVRQGHIVQRSTHQKHTFNTPFQLASPLPVQTSHFYRDLPTQAAQSSINIEPGDLLVVGTDGLFDNLTDTMILQELAEVKLEHNDPLESLHQCAHRLVDRARMAAFVPDFLSPFASEARRYGINIAGGVSGDITVILGLVINGDEIHAVEITDAPTTERTSRSLGRRRVHRWSESDLESMLATPILRSTSHSVPRQQP
ncbi:PTC7 protein phosphatase a [Fasciola gigantica]|uniref:Protein phosphatase n=1 Tax=Fasciola gigantica TaxID=46835 RepID=A0A504Y7R8_FASGI|nr:PTC7 protein phosphatase a [Fasciola gigantica]